MKKSLVVSLVVALALFLSGASLYDERVSARNDAAATVHMMWEPGTSCSVVMVAPGEALTARHCMSMTSPVVTIEGVDYPVTYAYGNPAMDMALLIIPNAPCPCAKPAPGAVQIGEKVMLIGYPYGLARVVTYGEMQERVELEGVLYALITAPARGGNSGGGVFNEKGELLGIVSRADVTGYLTFFVEIEPLLSPIQSREQELDEAYSFRN